MLENNRFIRFSGGRRDCFDAPIIRLMASPMGAPIAIAMQISANMNMPTGVSEGGDVGCG